MESFQRENGGTGTLRSFPVWSLNITKNEREGQSPFPQVNKGVLCSPSLARPMYRISPLPSVPQSCPMGNYLIFQDSLLTSRAFHTTGTLVPALCACSASVLTVMVTIHATLVACSSHGRTAWDPMAASVCLPPHPPPLSTAVTALNHTVSLLLAVSGFWLEVPQRHVH